MTLVSKGKRRSFAAVVSLAAACGLLLAGTTAAQPQAREPRMAPDLVRACAVLRGDAQARAAFPEASRHLQCDGDPLDVPACAARLAECEIDTQCSLRYTNTCTRPPCPPVANFTAACVPRDKPVLAKGILQYETCVQSGGRWRFVTPGDRAKPWRAECNCGPGTWETTPLDAPVWRYAEGRGCVPEERLCAEHRGTWKLGRIPNLDAKVQRMYCEIGGQPAQWGVLLPPPSFL